MRVRSRRTMSAKAPSAARVRLAISGSSTASRMPCHTSPSAVAASRRIVASVFSPRPRAGTLRMRSKAATSRSLRSTRR